MATRKQPPAKGKGGKARRTAAPAVAAPVPDKLSGTEKKQRREAIVQTDEARQEGAPARRDDLRMNMMRSTVTEPLLSKVQEDVKAKYEVIIALNELFVGGIDKAL